MCQIVRLRCFVLYRHNMVIYTYPALTPAIVFSVFVISYLQINNVTVYNIYLCPSTSSPFLYLPPSHSTALQHFRAKTVQQSLLIAHPHTYTIARVCMVLTLWVQKIKNHLQMVYLQKYTYIILK